MAHDPASVVVNHVGLCVSDLERSCEFYQRTFGFAESSRLQPPDAVCSQLLGIEEPVGLTAVYLERGDFTLELLHYERPGNPGASERVLNEPGLTHLSFMVGDLTSALDAVVAAGGTVVESTNVRGAVMVKDPDGQLLELIPRSQG